MQSPTTATIGEGAIKRDADKRSEGDKKQHTTNSSMLLLSTVLIICVQKTKSREGDEETKTISSFVCVV